MTIEKFLQQSKEYLESEEETKVLEAVISCELKYWVEKKKKEKCASAIVLELTNCYNCDGKNTKCNMYLPRVTY